MLAGLLAVTAGAGAIRIAVQMALTEKLVLPVRANAAHPGLAPEDRQRDHCPHQGHCKSRFANGHKSLFVNETEPRHCLNWMRVPDYSYVKTVLRVCHGINNRRPQSALKASFHGRSYRLRLNHPNPSVLD